MFIFTLFLQISYLLKRSFIPISQLIDNLSICVTLFLDVIVLGFEPELLLFLLELLLFEFFFFLLLLFELQL